MIVKPQFSLLNLLLAVTCFAVAAGWVVLSMKINGGRVDGAAVFIMLCPVSGAAIGGGVTLQFSDMLGDHTLATGAQINSKVTRG